jgi:hypothetical protein
MPQSARMPAACRPRVGERIAEQPDSPLGRPAPGQNVRDSLATVHSAVHGEVLGDPARSRVGLFAGVDEGLGDVAEFAVEVL